MRSDLASGPRRGTVASGTQIRTIGALVRAGFARYSTYRQAMLAASFTNSVFGFLRCFVLLAAVRSAGGLAGGSDAAQLATYAWVTQGLIGTVMLWGWSELGDRIRSGDVVTDLLRPVHPVLSYLAEDLGRAAYAAFTRFLIPIVVGAIFFDLYAPRSWGTYPLFVASVALGTVVSFGCRYLFNAAGFWLLDTRGVMLLWAVATILLCGLAFPLHFLPQPAVIVLWIATPFPSIMQSPLDVLVERGPAAVRVGLVAGQAAWAILLLWLCRYVQKRAERRLVIQGG